MYDICGLIKLNWPSGVLRFISSIGSEQSSEQFATQRVGVIAAAGITSRSRSTLNYNSYDNDQSGPQLLLLIAKVDLRSELRSNEPTARASKCSRPWRFALISTELRFAIDTFARQSRSLYRKRSTKTSSFCSSRLVSRNFIFSLFPFACYRF